MFISKIDFKICLKNRRQRLPDNVMCFTQNSFSGFTDFCIRNIKLHNFGRREIKIAEEVMSFWTIFFCVYCFLKSTISHIKILSITASLACHMHYRGTVIRQWASRDLVSRIITIGYPSPCSIVDTID